MGQLPQGPRELGGPNRPQKVPTINESFLGFVEVDDQTAAGLVNSIISC